MKKIIFFLFLTPSLLYAGKTPVIGTSTPTPLPIKTTIPTVTIQPTKTPIPSDPNQITPVINSCMKKTNNVGFILSKLDPKKFIYGNYIIIVPLSKKVKDTNGNIVSSTSG